MVSYLGFRSEVLMITHQNSFGILKNHWWEFFAGDDQWLSDQVCNSPNFIFSTSFWIANTSGCWGWQLSTLWLSYWQLWQPLILKIMLWLLWITIILVIFSSFFHLYKYHCYYLSHKIMIKRSSEDIWPDYLQTGTLLWKVCAPVELWNWLSCQNLFWIFWHFNIWQYLSQMLNIWTSIQVDGFQNRYFAFWHPLKSLCYIYSKNN